jgi:hypothetical protein
MCLIFDWRSLCDGSAHVSTLPLVVEPANTSQQAPNVSLVDVRRDEAGSGVLIVPWLSWFTFLGPGALVAGAVVGATVPRRPSWLVWQAIAGVAVIALAWQIGEWAGAYEDENPEGCSDCGTTWAFALVAMFASWWGWAIGTAIGGAIRFILGRSRLRG